MRHTNANIRLSTRLIDGDSGDPLNPLLNEVGDVRDDLDGTAQVISTTFPQADLHVDLAGGDVVVSGEVDAQISLVMTKIQVTLATGTPRVSFYPM